MNRLMLLAAGAALLTLGACEREVHIDKTWGKDEGAAMRTISRLDCPESQGELKRVSAAADGLSCAYQADGAEVSLRLVALTNGDAKAALTPIETELKGLIPPPQKGAAKVASTDTDGDGDGGKAEINFPGLHIKADDGGAQINIGGVHVDADEESAEVRVGEGTTVNANDGGAEIRTARGGTDAFRSTYILASDKAPDGYDVVGYEARGPKAGPIVVAVVKSKEGRDQHDLFDDMKELVKRNVGG
jgi:hypothetical protein